MITSRIDKRGRTTVPKAVRATLGLTPDAALIYEIKGGGVELRAIPADFSVFNEWAGMADLKAYEEL